MINERITLSYGSDYTPVPYTLSNLNCVLLVKLCKYAKNIQWLLYFEPNFPFGVVQISGFHRYIGNIENIVYKLNRSWH